MRPLDFIKTKIGNIGMIVEVSPSGDSLKVAIRFLDEGVCEKFACWDVDEFEVIGNLPNLLSQGLKHPFGTGSLPPFENRD